jgi:death-on-curing protein
VADLAAAYGVGLAKNYPFVDGNKRVAFLAAGLFALVDCYKLTATQAEAALTMLAVAANEMSEAQFAAWLREHLHKRVTA